MTYWSKEAWESLVQNFYQEERATGKQADLAWILAKAQAGYFVLRKEEKVLVMGCGDLHTGYYRHNGEWIETETGPSFAGICLVTLRHYWRAKANALLHRLEGKR